MYAHFISKLLFSVISNEEQFAANYLYEISCTSSLNIPFHGISVNLQAGLKTIEFVNLIVMTRRTEKTFVPERGD